MDIGELMTFPKQVRDALANRVYIVKAVYLNKPFISKCGTRSRLKISFKIISLVLIGKS